MWSPVNGPAAADGPCVTDLEKELSTYGDLTEFTYDNFVKSPDGKYHVAFKPADLLKAAYTGPLPPGSTKAQVSYKLAWVLRDTCMRQQQPCSKVRQLLHVLFAIRCLCQRSLLPGGT